MSYRDDGFAALERAEFLQHELDRSEAELTQLRAQLAGAPSQDFVKQREAELAILRARLDAIEHPNERAASTQAFDAGLVVFLLMMASMLVVVLLIATR